MDTPFSWLRHAYLDVRKAMDVHLAQYGLTFAQVEILAHLLSQDGLEHHVLLKHVGTTSGTLTGIIDGLVERGLIERRLSPDDARVKVLFLTENGLALAKQLHVAHQQFQEQLVQGFSLGEIMLFQEWLRRMAANASDSVKSSL